MCMVLPLSKRDRPWVAGVCCSPKPLRAGRDREERLINCESGARCLSHELLMPIHPLFYRGFKCVMHETSPDFLHGP